MTRKHFTALAEAICALPENPSKAEVIGAIARVCRSFNWRFDRQRFEAACKGE